MTCKLCQKGFPISKGIHYSKYTGISSSFPLPVISEDTICEDLAPKTAHDFLLWSWKTKIPELIKNKLLLDLIEYAGSLERQIENYEDAKPPLF